MIYFLIHTLCLGAFWVFYQAVLKKDTFFERNRYYLLLSVAMACLVPFMEISLHQAVNFEQIPSKMKEAYIISIREKGITNTNKIELSRPDSLLDVASPAQQTISRPATWQEILIWVYGVGAVISLILFLLRIGKLFFLIKRFQSCEWTKPLPILEIDTKMQIISNKNAGTFSFFNYLFWDSSLSFSEKEKQQILLHELAHIRGGDSYDLIFMQLQKVVFWFNPLIYLYEKELRNQHEFIADSKALTLTKTEDYISLMVSNLFKSLQIDFTYSFHKQQIKQRIKMLHTEKTTKIKGNAKTILAVAFMTQKHLIFTIGVLILSIGTIKSQDRVTVKTDSIYSKVDVLPEFPEGMKALGKYVDGKNHHYPKEARKNKVEGKVMIQFIINADGTPSDFKVIKGIGYGCDEAAVEAFKKMPKWKPAMIDGQPVRFLTQMGYLYKL